MFYFRYLVDDHDLDHFSLMSRKAHARVDCLGASKGLFCGLLVLVLTLISMLVYFVLVHNEELNHIAIYLADSAHGGIIFLTIIAMIIGFIR